MGRGREGVTMDEDILMSYLGRIADALERIDSKLDDIKSDTKWIENHTSNIESNIDDLD